MYFKNTMGCKNPNGEYYQQIKFFSYLEICFSKGMISENPMIISFILMYEEKFKF